jgi:hypothetical protein
MEYQRRKMKGMVKLDEVQQPDKRIQIHVACQAICLRLRLLKMMTVINFKHGQRLDIIEDGEIL